MAAARGGRLLAKEAEEEENPLLLLLPVAKGEKDGGADDPNERPVRLLPRRIWSLLPLRCGDGDEAAEGA